LIKLAGVRGPEGCVEEESTMTIQSACCAEDTALRAATENLGRPNCPRCGFILLVAEQSEFNLKGRIRHVWSCDDCGHEFITSIRLWRH
jgi:hypothetical protein